MCYKSTNLKHRQINVQPVFLEQFDDNHLTSLSLHPLACQRQYNLNEWGKESAFQTLRNRRRFSQTLSEVCLQPDSQYEYRIVPHGISPAR